MKKLIVFLFSMIILSLNTADAKNLPNVFDKVFADSNLSKSSVSISVQSLEKPRKYYQLNYETPMMPASTQKIITTIPAIQVLGKDYNFSTKLYKDKTKDEYYIVLGADPYLTTKELKTLLGNIKIPKGKNISKLYVDASIFDNVEWGEGWQWDDDLNSSMPRFNAYNLDKNINL